jgi:hypothetical protein
MAYLDLANAYPATISQPLYSGAEQQQPVADHLSALEWSVVALARRDRISSLGEPSRIATAMGRLFGTRSNPRSPIRGSRRCAGSPCWPGTVVMCYRNPR